MLRAILIGAAFALLVGGCGNGETEPEQGANASLRIKHVLDPAAEEHYMEGSIWHVRVVDGAGVEPGQDLAATVTLRRGHGCSIAIA
jgi:hypothetical protein